MKLLFVAFCKNDTWNLSPVYTLHISSIINYYCIIQNWVIITHYQMTKLSSGAGITGWGED